MNHENQGTEWDGKNRILITLLTPLEFLCETGQISEKEMKSTD